MIVTTIVLGAIALLPSVVLSAPVEVLGSKHTGFLASCVPTDCPIGLCDPDDFNISGAAYFASGPPTTTTSAATAFASSSSSKWEGVSRSITWSRYGTFKTSIDAKAASLKQGEIAGNATLTPRSAGDAEPFVCFKDGSTKFTVTSDGDGYTCTAKYYCPSVDAGTTTSDMTV